MNKTLTQRELKQALPPGVKEILASFKTVPGAMEAPCEIIMVERDDRNTPFVVWTRNLQNGGCFHGDYCVNRQEAVKSFVDRVKKEVR